MIYTPDPPMRQSIIVLVALIYPTYGWSPDLTAGVDLKASYIIDRVGPKTSFLRQIISSRLSGSTTPSTLHPRRRFRAPALVGGNAVSWTRPHSLLKYVRDALSPK